MGHNMITTIILFILKRAVMAFLMLLYILLGAVLFFGFELLLLFIIGFIVEQHYERKIENDMVKIQKTKNLSKNTAYARYILFLIDRKKTENSFWHHDAMDDAMYLFKKRIIGIDVGIVILINIILLILGRLHEVADYFTTIKEFLDWNVLIGFIFLTLVFVILFAAYRLYLNYRNRIPRNI